MSYIGCRECYSRLSTPHAPLCPRGGDKSVAIGECVELAIVPTADSAKPLNLRPGDILEMRRPPAALEHQVAGSHYKDFPIQPVEFSHRNGLGFCAGNVVKYICRYQKKGGRVDLEKARHYIDLMLELDAKSGSMMQTPPEQ